MESTHDRVAASRVYDIGLAEIHRKGCQMSGGHLFGTDRSGTEKVA